MPALSLFLVIATLLIFSPDAVAGNYTSSAHGRTSAGVKRVSIPGYDQGNCAHCHEQHASILSTDPAPPGGPKSYTLFARNFNDSVAANPASYVEGGNICFYCHNGSTSTQTTAFDNLDYSKTFGCATGGVTNILAAFNQDVFHDLKNIWEFSQRNDKNPAFTFGKQRNPCAVCHNTHRAKPNIENTSNTALSAISLPTDPSALYGVTETMDMYAPGSDYASPKCNSYREPGDNTSTDAESGKKTPDYPGLCTACHNADNYDSSPTGTGIWSTRLNRYLKPIDWSAEKHGALQFDGARDIQFPYNDTGYASSDLILSCLDCHEPHGSDNIYLLRRRVNGRDLGDGSAGVIDTCDSMQYGFLCEACHTGANDSIAGYSSNGPSWDTYNNDTFPYDWNAYGTHHSTADSPGVAGWGCLDCHSSDSPPVGDTLNCNLCHFHGASVSNDTETRVTF